MTKLFEKDEVGTISVLPSVIYPHYLQVIGHEGGLDQGALETARNVFTEDLHQVFGGFLHLRIERDLDFRLANFPAGQPPKAAIGTFYKQLPGTPATRLGLA